MTNATQFTVQRYKVVDQVYDMLKTQIIKGILPLGEEISVTGLAKKFNASKTPIREALIRLKGEGLVVEETDKGKMRVIELSPKEIAQIFELRSALETLALKWSFEKIPREKLEETLKMMRQAKKNLETGDYERLREADTFLHSLILAHVDNRWLVEIISQLRDLTEITKNLYISPEGYKEGLHYHIAIVEYILKGDRNSAIKNLNSDIEDAKRRVLVALQQKERDNSQRSLLLANTED